MGVARRKGGKSRSSYAVWEEGWQVPILTLEMVSHQPGEEYDTKLALYARLGVLYYVIYNPEFWQRDRAHHHCEPRGLSRAKSNSRPEQRKNHHILNRRGTIKGN
nr:Uma2 family endonuclease [Romeria gracilis]